MNDKSRKPGSKIKPKEIGLDKLQSSLAGMKLIEEFMKADPKTKKLIGKLLKKKKGGLVNKK